MAIQIKQVQLENTRFLAPLVRETSVTLATGKDCMWFLAMDKDKIVGFVCAKGEGALWRFKSAVVTIQYRGKGVYRKLWDARMKYVLGEGCKKITSFSSYDSRPMMLKEGFIEQHDGDNKHMYMIKEIE